ncbi:hypothetical protein ABZ297_26345 [Nonomuraea sp. NPDC005983]|uniref:hypothetical protein n=1 Tax=Nonomuraea sp. NPDC005983 TaxID=3155595 RepID=UPI0033B435DC
MNASKRVAVLTLVLGLGALGSAQAADAQAASVGQIVENASGASDFNGLVAGPSVKRNCGIVTCSWYMSRRTTRSLKDMMGVGGTMTSLAAAQICGQIPHPAGVAACAAGVAIVGASAAYQITAAANRKGCFVVRINMAALAAAGAFPPAIAKALRFDNVPSKNKYCYA